MSSTANDEALARALQEEEDLSPAPPSSVSPQPVSSSAGSTWGEWFSSASTQAFQAAKIAADASLHAAAVAKQQANLIAAQAQATYDREMGAAVFAAMENTPPHGSKRNRGNRGPSLNKELDLVYITENVLAMAFPVDPSNPQSSAAQSGNNIHEVAAYLKKHHDSKYMIWNISEEAYDVSIFENQVLEYKFPGHPSPPLGMLFKICLAIESWLEADADNVAVVHCLTGKGRTAALTSCVLAWLGEFNSPAKALEYIAERKDVPTETLTIPSQRRYVQYFGNTLDGVKPRPEPLLLRRIIMNTIPEFSTSKTGELGCCPYLQLFKSGKLICTSSPKGTSTHAGQPSPAPASKGSHNVAADTEGSMGLRWVGEGEGCVSFNVDCAVQGDILLRFRHADANGPRVSMFRTAFHTGYVPQGVMRLTKVQLDGSEGSAKFHDDFFIDLIFAPIEAQAPYAAAGGSEEPKTDPPMEIKKKGGIALMGHPSDSGLVIGPSSVDRYEQSLHNNAQFWEDVWGRKTSQALKKRVSRKFQSKSREAFSITDEPEPLQTSSPYVSSGGAGADAASLELQRLAAQKEDRERSADMDLIQQLAKAQKSLDGEEEQSDDDVDDIDRVLLAQAASKSDTAVQELNSELQALEDLEKELGLDDLGVLSTNQTPSKAGGDLSVPATTTAENAQDDDDFDELEKYLESITK